MSRLAKSLAIAVVVAFCIPPLGLTRAQEIGFACPKAGTVTVSSSTNTYAGADPADPVVCVGRNSSRGSFKELYNLWDVEKVISGDQSGARAALADLFSGRKATVTFTITLSSIGYPPRVATYEETFGRAGSEDVMIGDRRVHAVVLERGEKGSNGFRGSWRTWFDPATGLFVKKSQPVVQSGSAGTGSQLVSISTP